MTFQNVELSLGNKS
ncbi:hypothetical protein [Providencia rustigianii]